MYVCFYLCSYVSMSTRVCMYVLCVHGCVYSHVDVSVSVCKQVCACVCASAPHLCVLHLCARVHGRVCGVRERLHPGTPPPLSLLLQLFVMKCRDSEELPSPLP